jgi:hypothetical protein
MAVVVEFWDGKIASEHIYWDQATVLVQAGLIDGEELSVSGAESARKVLDPASVPSDGLMDREVTRSTPDTNSGRTATPPGKGLYLALPVDSRSRRNDGGEPSLHPQPDSTTVRPESVWALPIRAGETIIRKLKAEPEAPC